MWPKYYYATYAQEKDPSCGTTLLSIRTSKNHRTPKTLREKWSFVEKGLRRTSKIRYYRKCLKSYWKPIESIKKEGKTRKRKMGHKSGKWCPGWRWMMSYWECVEKSRRWNIFQNDSRGSAFVKISAIWLMVGIRLIETASVLKRSLTKCMRI